MIWTEHNFITMKSYIYASSLCTETKQSEKSRKMEKLIKNIWYKKKNNRLLASEEWNITSWEGGWIGNKGVNDQGWES